MRAAFVVVAWIGANLALFLYLGFRHLLVQRRIRREIDALEELLRLPAHPPSPRRRSRSVGRSTVAVAAVIALSGVAMATPRIRTAVVSTARGAVDAVTADRDLDVAITEATPSSRSKSEPPGAATIGPQPPDRTAAPPVGSTSGDDGAPAVGAEPSPSARPEDTPSPSVPPDVIASPSVSMTPGTSSPPSDATFTLVVEPISPTTIVVSWNDLPATTSYSVERALAGTEEWVEVARVPPGEVSTVSGGLEPATPYDFRVIATLTLGGEQVARGSATTLPPNP